MEKNGPRVYADARTDSYERSEEQHMYSYDPGRVVPIYIRLFPRNAYIAVIYRAEDGLSIHMCCTEGCGFSLCIVQGRAQAFSLEEIHELFWCCRALMIILTGCHPMSFISAMFGVKKNEEIAAEQEWVNSNGRVTLDIPASVNVKSFRFTGESASGSSAALKIQLNRYDNNYRTVDFYMQARAYTCYGLFKCDGYQMGRVHIFRYLHFVIMHGARGDKEYTGSIAFESKGWQ